MGEAERRLYVANLPTDISEDEIRETFELYGTVEDVHINKLKEDAKGRQQTQRSAFIGFEKSHDATAAMLVLSEMHQFREHQRTPIVIQVARPRWQEAAASSDSGPPSNTATHAQSSATQGQTPEPPAPPAPPARGGTSWGQEGNGSTHDSHGRDRQSPASNDKGTSASGAPGTKLWVGSLPGDVAQWELEDFFSKHGQLQEVSLMPVKSRSGQACAFVHYATPAEADACLAATQAGVEIRLGDGPIVVERPGNRSGNSAASAGHSGGYSGCYGGKSAGKPESISYAYGGKPAGKSDSMAYAYGGKPIGKSFGKPDSAAFAGGKSGSYGSKPAGGKAYGAGAYGKGYDKAYGKGGSKDYGKGGYRPY